MNTRRLAVLLLGLTLAGCSDPGDDIPPALEELHQRASAGDASAGRLVSVGLIIAGIIGLKLAHGSG